MRNTFIIVLIAFMIIGGCGSSDDGGSSDGGQVSCEDFLTLSCERLPMCDPTLPFTFEECIEILASAFLLDCDNVENTFSPECLVDVAELDCFDVLIPLIPESVGSN